MNNTDAIQALIEAGKWIGNKGWVPATGGNFSARTETGFVVTGSGFDKGNLAFDAFLALNEHGLIASGHAKPSAETGLHLALYQLWPNCQAVLHTHSIAATVLSRIVADDELVITGYEMQKSLAGVTSHLQSVSIAIFDNDQDIVRLVSEVKARLQGQTEPAGVLIRGHGVYVLGASVKNARQQLEGLEFLFACELERLKIMGRQ